MGSHSIPHQRRRKRVYFELRTAGHHSSFGELLEWTLPSNLPGLRCDLFPLCLSNGEFTAIPTIRPTALRSVQMLLWEAARAKPEMGGRDRLLWAEDFVK